MQPLERLQSMKESDKRILKAHEAPAHYRKVKAAMQEPRNISSSMVGLLKGNTSAFLVIHAKSYALRREPLKKVPFVHLIASYI